MIRYFWGLFWITVYIKKYNYQFSYKISNYLTFRVLLEKIRKTNSPEEFESYVHGITQYRPEMWSGFNKTKYT